jgi:hypothetical protein
MEAGKISVIYMGLIPGPNKTDEICGKTMATGTMHRGSTALVKFHLVISELSFNFVISELNSVCLHGKVVWVGKNV